MFDYYYYNALSPSGRHLINLMLAVETGEKHLNRMYPLKV